jgi:hypothetical protein
LKIDQGYYDLQFTKRSILKEEDWFELLLNIHTPFFPTPSSFICPTSTQQPKENYKNMGAGIFPLPPSYTYGIYSKNLNFLLVNAKQNT